MINRRKLIKFYKISKAKENQLTVNYYKKSNHLEKKKFIGHNKLNETWH